jgi:hypothetical protein
MMRSILFATAALFCGLASAFFVFYTARLLWVTHGLQTLRSGGRGAYVGAVVFPILAGLLGWASFRCAGAFRRSTCQK